MTFKKTEKEILTAIVKYGDGKSSLAEVLHKSKLLENKGIAIINESNQNFVFLDKTKYDDMFENIAFGYIAEMTTLIELLIKQRYIVMIPYASCYTDYIGVNGFRGIKPDIYVTNDNEVICLADRQVDWFDINRQQKCWPYHFSEKEMPLAHFFKCPFSVSQELRDLVKHNFKTEDERRFVKQQRLMWFSIFVAIVIGLLGLFK